jgi:transcription elongation factor Elf1
MIYIDSKYVSLLSYKLRNFKKKKENYWNFSCPICGDSKRDSNKARGYVFLHKSRLVYKCHNCGYSSNIGNLIKHLDANMYNEYVLERYKENANKHFDHTDIKETTLIEEEVQVNTDIVKAGAFCIESLPFSHPAVKYVVKRKIPNDKWKYLYFAPKFKTFVNNLKFHFLNTENDVPRLIIPYFDNGKVFAFQGRAFGDEQPKYITIKLDDEKEKIYGLDRIDRKNTVYVVEGPLDSLFIPNTVAVSGAGMDSKTFMELDSVIVMDNEPRSKEICNYIEKYIENGYKVCLWPDTIKEKDINEMILSGKKSDDIIKTINTNTYQGIEAKLKFTEWRKC